MFTILKRRVRIFHIEVAVEVIELTGTCVKILA